MGEMKDGGPAFPLAFQEIGGEMYAHDGMTLRDWFAGQALKGLLAEQPDADCGPTEPLEYAHDAYKMADAMLAYRERRGSGDGE